MDDPNASSEKQVAKATKAQKRARAQFEEDFRDILALPQGRRIIWWLLTECNIYTTTFTGDRFGDFKEGARSVGLKTLTEMMDICPEKYLEMIQENNESKKGG